MMRFASVFLLLSLAASPAHALAKVQQVSAGGATAWLIEDHSLPIVTVKVTFEDAGAASDPKGKEGLASFVGQMLDEGAGTMDSLAFNQALETHAIRMNTDVTEDMMTVTIQTLSEFKGDAFGLLNQALTSPRFDTEAVERIRASIESDLKQLEENPTYVASRKWKEIAFAGHPYEHPRRGTQTTAAALTREDMQGFVRSHFACDGKRIAVVGDITPDEVKQWLQAAFAANSNCPAKGASIPDITAADGVMPVTVEKPIPQTVVNASLPAVKRNDPRYYAVYVMSHILGGDSLTGRLGKEIRDKRGLAYYAATELDTQDHASTIMAYFASRSAEAQAAVDIFRNELKKMGEHGVTAQELEDAKNYLTGSFPLQIDNENALAEYLIFMQHFGLGIDYLEKRNSFIRAVTLDQVNEVAKTIIAAYTAYCNGRTGSR